MQLKLLKKRVIQKIGKATDDLIDNKIADKVTKVLKSLPQNSSEAIYSETKNVGFDGKMPKERNISLEKRQEFIDKLRLKKTI